MAAMIKMQIRKNDLERQMEIGKIWGMKPTTRTNASTMPNPSFPAFSAHIPSLYQH
jgi:hypothetical protein